MVYLASFIIFVFFVGSLALSLILRNRPLASEEEANAILEGLTCAACTMNCGFAGNKKHKPGKSCQAEASMKIAHKNV